MPDFAFSASDPDDDPVLCRCSQERIPADQARRLGCDHAGGCPEIREAAHYADPPAHTYTHNGIEYTSRYHRALIFTTEVPMIPHRSVDDLAQAFGIDLDEIGPLMVDPDA